MESRSSQPSQIRKTDMNIYVGNLPFTATGDDLRQIFEPYGIVSDIKIITDRDTGRSRGFGFVSMPDKHKAKAAMMGLRDVVLGGRSLIVLEARQKVHKPK